MYNGGILINDIIDIEAREREDATGTAAASGGAGKAFFLNHDN
jgi:hypothetical protein